MNALLHDIFFIGQGAFLSLALMTTSIAIGLTLGTLIAVLRHEKKGTWCINQFISVIRGTPLLLQLSFIYFALPALIGVNANIFEAGVLAFGLNSSAYTAEIIRAGIEHLPKGQFEAAKTLNISTFYLWKDIVLPQVFKNVFPALTNEMITLLKDTALISTIGGVDLMRRAQSIAAEQFTYFTPLCIAGLYYYVMVLGITFLAKKIELRNTHHAFH